MGSFTPIKSAVDFDYIQLPKVVDREIYPAHVAFPRPYRRKQILQMIAALLDQRE